MNNTNTHKFSLLPKKFLNSLSAVLVLICITSCEINDPIGDIAQPGYIAAGIYWDVPVTNVNAGNEVEFYAEYFSIEGNIGYVGLWYDVKKALSYTLTYPPNGFSFSVDSAELARELLEIKTFEHNENRYDPAKKAFVLEDTFPVSYTLGGVVYNNPANYNEQQFNALIPEYVRDGFLQELFPLLTYEDLQNLIVTNRQIIDAETFNGYFNIETVGETVVHTLKEEAVETLKSHLRAIPFGDLIYNRDRQFYAVEFSQGYQLNARLKVVNDNQVENYSETKVITVF